MADTLKNMETCLSIIEAKIRHGEGILLNLPRELTHDTRHDLHETMVALHTGMRWLSEILDLNHPALHEEWDRKWAYRVKRDVNAGSTVTRFIGKLLAQEVPSETTQQILS